MISKEFSKSFFLGAIILLPVLFFSACTKEQSKPLTDIEKRGKSVFVANCIACHNQDPRLAGSVGPDIAGSSLELVTERVLRQSYPQGYKPKRTTKIMPALPFLEKDLPSIHAYLNSFKR